MIISESLLHKYNTAVPRYTSYPPATSFDTSFKGEDFVRFVQQSNQASPHNISIYIHIPFCPQRCHFCGCNTVLYPREEKIEEYVRCVQAEIRMTGAHVDKSRRVTQVSWGGGTPNSIKYEYIESIMNTLREVFTFDDGAEIAIECSPAYLEFEHVDHLKAMGFNRISLGIQDFHLPVLDAINRKPPLHPVEDMLKHIKSQGFKGVNIDLVYGLPLQTVESFAENIAEIARLQPDRLATFSYAHVPWFNENQKRLEIYPFPQPDEKLTMLVNTINFLSESGYDVIGMDHFAKKDDELAMALREHNLHRNFQGYNTKKTSGQVYAFGASGISQMDGAYAQNVKSTPLYVSLIQSGKYATERGYALTQQDKIIRDTIDEIMCNGKLHFGSIAEKYGISMADFYICTAFDQSKVASQLQDGIVTLGTDRIAVNEAGMMVVRNIAAAFDPQYKPEQNKYSKTL